MTFYTPQFLALLLVLPVLIVFWRWRGMRVGVAALVLRLCAVTLLIFALAEPTLGREAPPPGPMVLLVDQSDSLTEAGQIALRDKALRLAQQAENAGDSTTRTTLLYFGANTVAETTSDTQDVAPTVDPSASDLASALRTAHELLARGGGQIVLLSDGLQTRGNALAAAQALAADGLSVDVWPFSYEPRPDLHITGLEVPRSLHINEQRKVRVFVDYTPGPEADPAPVPATLRLWEGRQQLDEREILLAPGQNAFSFDISATNPGVLRLRAEVIGTPDTFAQNNNGAATTLVAPPPRILLVEGRPNSAQNLNMALRQANVEVQAISPQAIPTRLSELERFDGMVLIDVPVNTLSLDQMSTVREFVRSEGRGLVVTGGRNSFGLGAYKGTPLEEVLPVAMDPPPRPQRSDIALLLIIDRSASMTAASGISKFDMAKEAAILSTEALQDEDHIGIMAFDTGHDWVVSFQQIRQGLTLKEIQDAIALIPSGGGTDIFNALNMGLGALARQPTTTRHAVLLTDGRSFTNNRDDYQRLIEAARNEQITLSTIAIGQDSDIQLLDELAKWGNGRYYFATTPEDIPRLTLLESEIARSDPTVEGSFQADLAMVHPLLEGFAPSELPNLDGYVATTPKDAAEVVLESAMEDPVLSAWQYGLGRAVAWTPSVDDPWASSWLSWQDFGRFWAQVVRYTLPEPDSSGPLQVRFVPQADGVQMTVDAFRAGGVPLDLADVNARITLPDGTQLDIRLPQVAPGRYVRDLRLTNSGPYGAEVTLALDDIRYETTVGYVQPVPAEYVPTTSSGKLQGQALLEQIASTTGGSVIDTISSDTRSTPQQSIPPARPLWPWFATAALLVWVLEVAIRRGVFVRQ